MTREELKARIQSDVERQGYAVIPSGKVWEVFVAPGEDTSVSFDNALSGFAVINGWEVRRNVPALADMFAFYPAGEEPTLVETPQGS